MEEVWYQKGTRKACVLTSAGKIPVHTVADYFGLEKKSITFAGRVMATDANTGLSMDPWDDIKRFLGLLGTEEKPLLVDCPSGTVSRSYRKIYESNSYVDNKLASRVAPLMWGSQCIGTATRVSRKGILVVHLLSNDEKDNLHNLRAFGGRVKMLTESPERILTLLRGRGGEAFDVLSWKLQVGQGATLIAYPQAEVNEIEVKEKKIEGVVDFINPTGYGGTVSYSEAVNQLKDGAITIGDKLLVGMHVVRDPGDVKVGNFLPGWWIAFIVGEFDKEPRDRPSSKRSRRK